MNRIEGFEEFLRAGGATGRALGEDTISTYLKVAKAITRARSPLAILKPTLSMSTKYKYVAVLRQWAKFIGDVDLTAALKPGPELRRLLQARASKLPEKVEAFSDQEVKKFLRVLRKLKGQRPTWAWPCISLQVHLALRVGADLAGLRRDAVRQAIESGRLAVMGKGERMDHLPAGFVKEELEVLAALGRWHIVADLISPESKKLPEHKHRQQAYQVYRRVMEVLGEQAGIEATKTHRFRHWAITNFIKKVAKGDYKRAQRFARHASLETTMRYYKTVDLSEDDEALAKLKGK